MARKKLKEADKGVIKTKDPKVAKDLADQGANVNLTAEQEGLNFDKEETKSIAKKVGASVLKALSTIGEEVSDAKAQNIEPGSFEVHVVYKNDSTDEFSFYIKEDTLHLVDFSFDKELCDVGVQPSGEAQVNIVHCSDLLAKHFKSMNEDDMRPKDKEFAQAQQDTRRDQHPEADKIKQIQQMMANLKEQSHKVIVPTGQAEKALGVLKDRLKGHFSPLGPDTFAFGDERAKKAAEMLLAKSGIEAEGVLSEGRIQDVEALLGAMEKGSTITGGGYEYIKKGKNHFQTPRGSNAHAAKIASMIGGFDDLKVIMPDGREVDLMAALNEAPAGVSYIKVSVRDARRALAILDDSYGGEYEISGSDTYYFGDEDTAAGAYEDLEGSGIEIIDTNLEDYMQETEVPEVEPDMDMEPEMEDVPVDVAPEGGADIEVGREDDEPGALKQHAYDIAHYAAKLYKQLDQYEQQGEVDFPNWWQEKVILAREFIGKAQHYLEFEDKQPALDQLALESFRGGKKVLKEYQGFGNDLKNMIHDKAEDSGFSHEEEVEEIKEFLASLRFDDNGNLEDGPELREYVNVDKVAGGIPYKQSGTNAIITEPLDDAAKERIIAKCKEKGLVCKPNNAGGVTIFKVFMEQNVKEGSSQEELKIVRRAINQLAKYRGVSVEEGLRDLLMAAKEIKARLDKERIAEDEEEDARNDADTAMYDRDYSKKDGVVKEEEKLKGQMKKDYDAVFKFIEKNPMDFKGTDRMVKAYRKKYNLSEAGTYCGNCGKTHPKSQSC